MENNEKIELKEYTNDPKTGEVVELKEALATTTEIVEKQLTSQLDFTSGKDKVQLAVVEQNQLEQVIKQALTKDVHYGVIPYTKTPSLYQAGADSLAKIYGLTIELKCIGKELMFDQNYIDFTYEATAYWKGQKLRNATASANSKEQKFRSHYEKYDEKLDKYVLIKGKSVFDIKNTLEQMAQKRAKVRVVRETLGITGAFTQDLEDIQNNLASKDERMGVYSALYTYKKSQMGKNDEERKNWLKLNILKPLCEENKVPNNLNQWTVEDVNKIIDGINNKASEMIAKLGIGE